MRILALGDVTDTRSVSYLKEKLWDFRTKNKIDFTIVNGENAGFVYGASPEQAFDLFSAGADVITGGNHTMQNKYIHSALISTDKILRPINYPSAAPGMGYTIQNCNGYNIIVINALGSINMEPRLDNPIPFIERALEREKGKYDFSVLDFHAEATGEKGIVGRYFDGKINIIFGTHTHVPTSDARIFEKKTAFVSDIGMCGAKDSILGINAQCVINKYITHMPTKYIPAEGDIEAQGVIFDLNEELGHVTSVEPITF